MFIMHVVIIVEPVVGSTGPAAAAAPAPLQVWSQVRLPKHSRVDQLRCGQVGGHRCRTGAVLVPVCREDRWSMVG